MERELEVGFGPDAGSAIVAESGGDCVILICDRVRRKWALLGLANRSDELGELGRRKRVLHESHLLVVDTWIDTQLHFAFEYVVDVEIERDTCQRPDIRRISRRHRFGENLRAFLIRRADNHDHVPGTVALYEIFD
jgi:hypothetical protein